MHELNFSLPTSTANLHPEPKIPQPPRLLLTPLPTAGEFLLVLDNSSLEVFTTCPKAAQYKLVMRREAHARNAALTFGGAIHQGLEKFLYSQYDDQQAHEVEDAENQYGETAQNAALVQHFLDNPPPLDEYRTVSNALEVLKHYRTRASMPDYAWEILSDYRGPLIERAFELPLGVVEVNDWISMPWLSDEQWGQCAVGPCPQPPENYHKTVWVNKIHLAWSGRIDAIARCGDPRIARVVDHKTGKVDPQEYHISNPVLGYVWAGQRLWPELNIGGFCLNALSTKKPAVGCSLVSAGPRGGKPALDLSRHYFEYSAERLAEWETNVIHIVSDFIHCLVRNFHPRHTKWCLGKYGQCQYYDVCIQDKPEVRHRRIQSDMFKPVTWNPTEGR